jgi:EAL domain-containing protein (putative c-di-GMP-specific phosphodiesterase class I)/ActR/RegA family two-component response regulator
MTENITLPQTPECKIYTVDDDEQQAHLMQAMAKTAKLETLIYTSSIDFLSAPVSQYDIVVLDLQMPEKDGIEIMRDLASKNIRPNFILVSGFDERVLHSAKQLAESKHLSNVTTLSKPLRAKTFISLLNKTYNDCELKRLQETAEGPDDQDLHKQTDVLTIEELKLAIRQRELVVYFQPKICFNRKSLQGAEVLIHWMHPTRGLISPEQFIPLAEEHKLMNLLTEEILKQAIQEHQKFVANGLDIQLSINLSAQNINDLSMPEKLEALVKSNQIKPESFTLEITESSLMNEISESLDILNRLRMKGFLLSINNFGTGYSSLVKLYQAPFSELKIDRHFIMRMTSDTEATAIVKICILLARELKMQIVAEGVETEETWNQLKKMGCDIAQGNFIASPMPTNDFIDWVKNEMDCSNSDSI